MPSKAWSDCVKARALKLLEQTFPAYRAVVKESIAKMKVSKEMREALWLVYFNGYILGVFAQAQMDCNGFTKWRKQKASFRR